MFRLLHLAFLAVVLALGAIGISRLSYNVEILDLLPRGMKGVEGTKWFQKVYERPDQLIITVQAASDAAADDAVNAIAEALHKSEGLTRRVRVQPSWEENPQAMLDLVALPWLNAPPEQVQALTASLAPGRIETTIKERLARLGTALDPISVALASNDVLGLTTALRNGMDSEAMQSMGGGGYMNEDGTFRVLYVDAFKPMNGYREAALWLGKIKAAASSVAKPGVTLGYTGAPAFQAEIGSGMEGDMSQSVSGITFIVALLFWLLHRQIRPLFLILAAMLATGLITLGLAGLLFGSLNVMSMGFAAILMGMIEDFGVLGLNEAMSRPGESFRQIHARIVASIAWSAVTSAAVFAALGLSTLPGIAQMGVLTALGILVGAAVMLYGFLPVAMKLGKAHAHAPALQGRTLARWPGLLLAMVALLATGTLLLRGLPAVNNGTSALRPKHCQAFEALMTFERELKPDRDRVEWLPIVVRRGDVAALADTVAQVNYKLQQTTGLLGHYMPVAFVPNPQRQQANFQTLHELATQRERLFQAASAAGVSDQGLGLAKGFFEQLDRWQAASDPWPRWPDLGKLDDSLGRQLYEDGKDFIACGFLRLPKTDAVFQSPVINQLQATEGVHISGWNYLNTQLKTVMAREVKHVLLPAVLVLAVMFFFVFHTWRERALALGSIAFSGLILLGGMSALGMEWNFVNIGTIPLCLGLGLDFNINMIYALRNADRNGEDASGTGRALAYCGLSTGLGFGALAMSDNVGLSTFGICSMIGVLATLFVSAFLLPWVWQRISRR